MTKTTDRRKLLQEAIREIQRLKRANQDLAQRGQAPLAIVGGACRFPGGVNDLASFHQQQQAGVSAVTPMCDHPRFREFRDDPILAGLHAALLDDIEGFDGDFFNIPAREAAQMDPHQRLLLEVAHHALEDAGIPRARLAGTETGVFIGTSSLDHALRIGAHHHGEAVNAYTGTGAALSINAGRLSHGLGVTGPSLVVDTACSSSLVAIHLACQSLRRGECRTAIAAGINLILAAPSSQTLAAAGVLSPSGACHTFAAAADGYVRGEGCAALVLKTLQDAETDGDTILAVIHGSATNHDGASSGLTVPTGPAQARVIQRALADAGLSADDIDYLEAHGTGTQLGDPIEVNVLGRLFGAVNPPAIGSAKTMIGHLEAAAGIAGVLRTALALHHGRLPAHLHFEKPNQHINWDKLPLVVNTESRPWPQRNRPAYAGVSSFGIGGSNAHVVLGAPPRKAQPAPTTPPVTLLTLSAHNPRALKALAQTYRDHERPSSLAVGVRHQRDHFPTRLALVGQSDADLKAQLDRYIINGMQTPQSATPRRLAMMIGGQGTQYAGMGAALDAAEPVFRAALDECAELLVGDCDVPLREILNDALLLAQTQYAQPAIFSVAYASAKLWQHWGLTPELVFGHSVGEYVAACLAGIFTLETALKLVAARGRFMATASDGAMAAIHRDEHQTRALLQETALPIDIAALNSPRQTVVAGTRQDIEQLISQLKQRGIGAKLLPVAYAFHSRHMDDAAAAFADIIADADLQPARLPIIANVSGRLDDGAMSRAQYWVDHIRQPVLFAASLRQAANLGINSFLEVGACSVLTGPARQNLSDAGLLWLTGQKRKSETDPATAQKPLLTTLAQWYAAGGKVAWHHVDAAYLPAPVKAPLYPFQHDHYPLIGSSANPLKTTPSVETSQPAALDSDRVLDEILSLLADVLMVPKASIDPETSLLELGSDSVALADAAQKLERRFSVRLQLRQFFEDLQSPRLLAAHITAHTPLRQPATPDATTSTATDDDAVAALFKQQLDIMQRQLAVLEGRKAAPRQVEPAPTKTTPRAKTTLPWGGLNLATTQLPPRQQAHLDALTAAYTARTQASKHYAADSRRHLTDNRASAGFRFSTKEMLYPIVAERSTGAYFWDLDGNRYIDITMGFGTYLLGHQPAVVTEALQHTLATGIHIGPQSALAGKTAALICQLTGADRAAFLNSGTEAVMTACRLARATTGRRKIVMFAGAYHGHGDATLGSADENGGTYAAIAGIPDSAVADMVVLPYGDDSALRYVAEQGHNLAAVLVEPVQSRNPGLQPRAFLHRLRELTRDAGCALIFDEMITGFRSAPGGAQAWFDVRADLCTYGKVVGGGMPIGVVAGSSAFMDALDGGTWSFGDDSYPAAETTFFAGTFCKHPLTMAAAHAVLSHIEAAGPSLQQNLNARTAAFADELNAWFREQAVPIRIDHFASLFRFSFQQNLDLFFYHLVHQGVYIWEGRTCFFSTAHSDADIAAVKKAIKSAVTELRRGGFLGDMAEDVAAESSPDRFPLSAAQQQMLLARARDSGADNAYHLTADLELVGELDIARLAEAYQAVQRRHAALRLRNDGEQQWLDEKLDALQQIDLSQDQHPTEALQLGLSNAANAAFDLQQQAPCRALLFQTAPQQFHLHLRLHHVVADGWSAGLVLNDLWQCYAGRGETKPAPSFGAYLQRQHQNDHQHQQNYWLERFRGRRFSNPFPVRIGTGHALAGTRHRMRFPATALKNLAAAHGVTPFMLLLTAWCRRLQQHAENRDWIIATPSMGRGQAEDQGVVGYCTHLLPLLALPGGDSFTEHLQAMRGQILDAFENADVPFAEWFAQLSREQGATPAPAALFNYEKAPTLPAVNNLAVTLTLSKVTTSAFPIIFNAVDHGDCFELACDFQHRYFDENQVIGLLKALADDLRVLTETENVAVTRVKPQTAPLAPRDPRWLSQRLADFAAATPHAPAIRTGDETRDYAALYQLVQHLAADLRTRGIGPEHQVALVAAPGINRIAALLALWHCGAVAVVIDDDQPVGRRHAMLQRLQIALTLGDTAATDRDLALDSWVATCLAAPARPSQPTAVDADNAAYLVHTSGSSGAPKPVCITYGGYRHVTDDLGRRYQIGAGDRLLQLVGLHFDVAMADIALALGNGACLVLAPSQCLRDGDATVALLARERISHVQLPPSALTHWPEHALPDLRHLILGGEVCSAATLSRWADNRTIHNAYGPSETTITVSAGLLEAGVAVDLGHALPGCTLRVVDDQGREVADGTAGELVIGGPTLARGYAGDARLSASKFVPDPHASNPGARLYRSGDRVCRNSDGTLRFIGRMDRQIKWRGLRIELGEIEQALRACSGVSQAAVVFRDNRLDGYVTGTDLDSDGLHRELATRLPATHLPQSLTVLAFFPLTANGKLDQRALPRPEHKPRRPLQKQSEQQIAEIWRELLPGVAIGADSHFFELGGHSLLAGQVRTRLRERFGLALDLPELFEFPILADLARIAESRQRQTAVLITAAPADAVVTLTSQQQRLWFLDQFDGPSATHNMPLALHLHGDLDENALELAIAALNRRHPMLTSYVLERDDQALIGFGQAPVLRKVRLQAAPELARRLETESQTPFALNQGPLARWTLFHLAPQHQVLALTLHHLIADGWSMGVLLGDLTAGYNAARNGRALPTPASGLQYRDFAYHQQQQYDHHQVSADFWRQNLADLPPLLELPTDRPRPRQQDYRGALLPVHFSTEVAATVTQLAQQQGVTPFMVLLAGFQLLLADWSGSNDIAVGTPVAGRDHGDLEQVVGLFLNTLVLRNHIDHNRSFADLLAQVKDRSLAAFNHADLPFERVVDLLQPQRSLAHAPLFQVMFILNNAPLAPLQLDGLRSSLIEQPGSRSEFDLTLSLRQDAHGLVGDLEYRTDLFDRATMERLRDSLEHLLQEVCRQPQRRLSTLSLLPAATTAQLRAQSAAPPLPAEALHFPIHRRFEAWAQHAGDRPAVIDGTEQRSYDALNQAANQLAHHLRSLGLAPESQVGICLPRGITTITAVLACLKAGLVYVPLDPRLPSGRLASMVYHSDIKLLMTNAATDSRADWYSGTKANLDALADHLATGPDDNLDLPIQPEQAAYAVFTSGTTGAPKAVVNTHAALASTAAAWLDTYDLQPDQAHLQMAAFSFDVWGGDLMRALCSGARLVICPADTLLDPPGLYALLQREQVTHAEFVPAVLRHLVQWLQDAEHRLDFMTMIVTGSDLWYARDQAALEAVCNEATRLINSYGLTEASIDSTWYQAPRGSGGEGGILSIGQAFAGVETWILNRFGHLAAPGVVGELCIGGPGIARGYHGLPAKTAEAFVPHPFPSEPGARLYRTGDLARRHHNGTIELVGRRDHQVKIRGFRIETAEIEAHLTAHDAVHVAVVQARGDAQHRYLVCHYTGPADSDLLRDYLATRLPDYMVPALWQHRDSMPLTANGKIDRLRLAQSELAAPAPAKTKSNAVGPAATLLTIWRDLLPHKEIGLDDNFFARGGDSILSLQVVAKARQAGLTVTAKQIFEHQTIAELAQVVTTNAAPAQPDQQPVSGAVALTPIQIWFFQQAFAQAHHFNQALLFEQRTPLDAERVRATLTALAAHHDQLRARFSQDALGAVVQWIPDQETGNLLETLQLDDLQDCDEAERRTRIATHCAALQNTLDLAQGPPWRVFLLDCGTAPALLLWVCHHLIIDGVSWRILLEDFATVYAALEAGDHPNLPPKSIAFQSYAQRRHAAAREASLRDELSYWQNALADAPPLPIDNVDGGNRHADLALVQVGFDQDTTHQLLHEIPQNNGLPLQTLLLAALTHALAAWSKKDGALLEVEHHGRDGGLDVARTVGWFTTTYPLWLPSADTFDQLLKQTKQRLHGVPNDGVGFGLLRTLHPDPAVRRAMAALPEPRIGFNYLGQLDSAGGEELPLQAVEDLLLGDSHSDNARTLELEITAHIQQGRLTVTFDYSRERFAASTINNLSDGLQRSLSGLITHCLAGDAPLLTPSDFPNADLAQDDLDRLLTFLG